MNPAFQASKPRDRYRENLFKYLFKYCLINVEEKSDHPGRAPVTRGQASSTRVGVVPANPTNLLLI